MRNLKWNFYPSLVATVILSVGFGCQFGLAQVEAVSEGKSVSAPTGMTAGSKQSPSDAVIPASVRTLADREKFYRHQNDGVSCSAFSMAMMYSDHKLGRPVTDEEVDKFKVIAGLTPTTGYRGTLDDMAHRIESVGLHAKVYQYKTFDETAMSDLNRELALGHSAVGRVINPHTGNPHYIYIAGRDAGGMYIIGDPDRKNLAHSEPVAAEQLFKMMSGRDGFVAGW
jgi:hypothetical protein